MLIGTHLGILGFDPTALEAVVPEVAFPRPDVAVILATRQAPEPFDVRARSPLGGGRYGVRFPLRVPLAQSTEVAVLALAMRAAADGTPGLALALPGLMAPPPAILAEGFAWVLLGGVEGAQVTVDVNLITCERLRAGALGGVPEVEKDRGHRAGPGLLDDARGTR